MLTYNPFLPEVREDPYPTFRALREADPVHRSPFLDAVLLTRYDDVSALLRDPRFSADRRRWDLFPEMEGYRPSMLSVDPPEHTRLRAVVGGAFTRRVVEQARPWAERFVGQALDRAARTGRIEVVEELAEPLSMGVIGRLLGLPPEDEPFLRTLIPALVASLDPLVLHDPERRAAYRAAEDSAHEYLAGVARRRRSEPAGDLVSALAAVAGGDAWEREELPVMLNLLQIAGHETTVGLVGNGVLALLRHPDELARLRTRPDLLDTAIEELLRWDAPAQLTARVAIDDCELGGTPVRRGQLVVGLLAAANRDPAQFPEPERLDLGRSPNRHLSFGGGVHFCLGAPLARLEARIAIGELVRRFPGLRLDGAPVRKETITLRGLSELPLATG